MKRVGLFLLVALTAASLTGCGPQYVGWNSTLVAPPGGKQSAFEDDKIGVAFVVGKTGVAFVLRNKTSQGIKINWDEIALVRPGGDSQRVIHTGIRLMERNAPQPLSVVPPNGKISDSVTPSENIYYVSGKYGGWDYHDLFPPQNGQKKFEWAGTNFSIYFPMEIEGARKEYTFTLRLDSLEMKAK